MRLSYMFAFPWRWIFLPESWKSAVDSEIKKLYHWSNAWKLSVNFLNYLDFYLIISDKFWSPCDSGGLKKERELDGEGFQLKSEVRQERARRTKRWNWLEIYSSQGLWFFLASCLLKDPQPAFVCFKMIFSQTCQWWASSQPHFCLSSSCKLENFFSLFRM